MPELKLSQIKSVTDYAGPTRVNHNNFGAAYETLGSKDTMMGKWMGNYYDKNFIPERSQVNQRYENQGSFNSFMSSAFRLGASVGSGIASTGAVITSLPALFVPGVRFTDVMDANPLTHLAEGVRKGAEYLSPTFVPDDFDSLTFTKQLTQRPTQLFTSSIESLGFMVEMFVPGGVLPKLAVGPKIAAKLATAKPLFKALTPLKGKNLTAAGDAIDFVTTNEILSLSESYLESKDSYEANIKSLERARFNGENNFTDQDIEKAARQSQYNVFWENMLTTSLTNGVFTKLLMPLRGGAKADPLKLSMKDGKFVAPTYSSKFERFLFDSGNTPGVITKQLLANTFAEGLEEDLQYSIQKVNEVRDVDFKNTFGASINKYLSDLPNLVDFADKDRSKAIGLGALLGGASVAIGSTFKGSAYKEAKDYKAREQDALTKLNSAYTDLTKSTIFQTDPGAKGKLSVDDSGDTVKYFNEIRGTKSEIPKSEYDLIASTFPPEADGSYQEKDNLVFDSNGAPVKDPNKVAQFLQDYRVQNEFNALIDSSNELISDLYRQNKLGKLAETAHAAGVMDILIEQFETADNLNSTPETQSALAYLSRMKPLYETVDNSILFTSYGDVDNVIQQKAYAKSLGSRIVSIDSILEREMGILKDKKSEYLNKYNIKDEELEKSVKNLSSIEMMKNKAFRQLASQEVTEKLKGAALLKKVSERSILMAEEFDAMSKNTELESLVLTQTKLDELIDSREFLGKIFDKVIKPSSGLSFFKKEKASPLETVVPFDGKTNVDITTLDLPSYKLYEQRVLRSEKLLDKQSVLSKGLREGYTDSFMKWIETEGDAAEIASSLRIFIENIINQNTPISESTFSKLERIHEDVLGGLYEKQKVTDSLLATAGVSEEDYLDQLELEGSYASPEEYAKIEEVQDLFKEVNKIKEALGDLYLNPDQYLNKLRALVNYTETLKSDDDLRLDIASRILNGGARILFASKYDGQTIDESYTALSDVQFEINKLTKSDDQIFSKDDFYKEISEDIQSLLPTLIKIESLVKQNISNQELKSKMEAELYFNALASFDLFDPNFNSPTFALYNAIEKLRSDDISQNIENVKSSLSTLGVTMTPNEIDSFLKSPVRGLTNIFSKFQYPVKNESISQFKKDYDIIKLLRDFTPLENHGLTKARFDSIIDAYLKSLIISRVNLNSDLDIATIYDKYIEMLQIQSKAKDKGDKHIPVPSLSQEKVIVELVQFLSSPVTDTKHVFENTAVLKAPAGAGKTLVILPYVKHILGLSSNEIYTAAPFPLAAKNIAASLQTPTRSIEELTEELNQDAISSDVELIVVDEAAAATTDTLNDLAVAHAKFLQRTSRPVKLVMVYDPNQTSSSLKAQPDIEDIGYEVPSGFTKASTKQQSEMALGDFQLQGRLRFTQNIFDLSPLSTTYRSPVSEIVDIQNEFKTTSAVGELKSATSSSIDNPKDILGVHIEVGAANLMSIIQKSSAMNPNRSRAIITTPALKSKYETDLTTKSLSAAVLTAAEAQSATFDEVYVDVPKTSEDYIHNRDVYTATSRASKFLYLNHVGSSVIDPSISDRVKDALSRQTSLFTEELAAKKEDLSKISAPIAQEPVDVGGEIIDVDNEIESVDEPITEVITIDKPFEVTHPTNEIFKLREIDGTAVQPITPDENVKIVKDISNGKERIVVLREISPVLFQMAGVLTDAEAKAIEVGNLEGVNLSQYRDEFYATKDPIASFVSSKIGGNKLTYHYSEDYTKITSIDDILSIFSKWASDLGYSVDNLADITADPSKYLSPKAFKTAKEYLNHFNGVPPFSFKLNTPYLTIRNIVVKGTTLKGQAIRLNSTKLTNDTILKEVTDGGKVQHIKISHIQNLVKYVQQFEDLLSKSSLTAYANVRLGEPFKNNLGTLKDSDGNEFYIFHKLVASISDRVINGNKKDMIHLDYESEKTKSLDVVINNMPPIDPSAISDEMYALAAKIDSLTHFGDEDHIESGKLKAKSRRQFGGHAQVAMNAIASTNTLITLPSGTARLLRTYRSTKTGTILQGRSLMGPVHFEKGRYAYNPILSQKMLTKLSDYRQYLTEVGKQSSLRYKLVSDLINSSDKSILREVPFTSTDLKEIFIDTETNGEFNVSEGFGFRAPILVSKEDVSMSNLATSFTHVTPTKLFLSKDAVESFNLGSKKIARPTLQAFISSNYTSSTLSSDITKRYDTLEIDSFILSSPYKTLQDAVDSYIGASKLESLATAIVNKSKTVSNLLATPLDILEVFDPAFMSLSKFGARDTARLAILLKILPNASLKQLTIWGTMFSQNRWYHSTTLQGELRISEEAVSRLKDLYNETVPIGEKYGIEITYLNSFGFCICKDTCHLE